MAKQQHCLLVVLVLAFIVHAAYSATVYDIVQRNNLPRALIPQGVKSFVLHPDGHVEVTLPGECNFFLTIAGMQYKIRFGSSFSGIVHPGSVSEVASVRVQTPWGWQGIFQVDRAGDQLTFKVGTSTVSFPASDSTNSPVCS